MAMQLSLEVPDDIRVAIESHWDQLSVHVREHLALEGYRQGFLSLAQVRRLLELPNRWEAQLFLGRRGVDVFDLDSVDLDREASLQNAVASRPSTSA